MRARSARRWIGEGLLLVALTALATAHGRTERAVAAAAGLLDEGRPEEALRRLGGAGEHDATAAYILGSAHLALGGPADALEPLALAVAGGGPELQRRAWHNLSVARLRLAGEESGEVARVHAREAVVAAIQSLRLNPGHEGTRWNLALAWKILDEEGPGAAESHGTPSISGPGGAGPTLDGDAAGMTPEEAARVLDALRSAEGPNAVQGLLGGRGGGVPGSPPRRGPPW
jgi:hypothetical protein